MSAALFRRIEALGFVAGSENPEGWVVALAEELTATLANEHGEGPAPAGWERNDVEPPAISWYRRCLVDGSEAPDGEDTADTRVLWAHREPDGWKWEVETVYHLWTETVEGTAPTARAAMLAADAALLGGA